jgi:hypothetical protein
MVHRNAPLSETERVRLARCVVEDGWPLRRAAERFQVSHTTAARRAGRYRQSGAAGMTDRPSRPYASPRRIPVRTDRIVRLRVSKRLGPARIAGPMGMHASTLHAVLVRYSCPPLAHLDRGSAPRYAAGPEPRERRVEGTIRQLGRAAVSSAAPEAGAEWTDNGKRRDHRHLKSRPVGEWRRVPVAPPLTRILRVHLREFGTGPGERVFAGVRGGELSSITYRRSRAKARRDTLTAAECTSPLAGRVYDLRHACVSTWLNGGIPPAQVAEWAGHSVAILLKIYAKCLDGQDAIAKRRIEEALGDPGEDDTEPGGRR